jgi:hypothetical protein
VERILAKPSRWAKPRDSTIQMAAYSASEENDNGVPNLPLPGVDFQPVRPMIIAFVPRFLLHRLVNDPAAAWHTNVVVSHTALLLAIPLSPLLLDMIGNWPHTCLSRQLFGVPCPGCGITTSVGYLSQSKLAESFAANPAGIVLVMCLLLQLLLHTFALQRCKHRRLCNLLSRRISVCGLSALLIVWLCRFPFCHL